MAGKSMQVGKMVNKNMMKGSPMPENCGMTDCNTSHTCKYQSGKGKMSKRG